MESGLEAVRVGSRYVEVAGVPVRRAELFEVICAGRNHFYICPADGIVEQGDVRDDG